MDDLLKYPRTRHIEGSGLQRGDESDVMPFVLLAGVPLVVEEKVDGANVGVSFDTVNGELRLQCRGHYLSGGPGERQFALLKPWAQTHQSWLWERLGARYILYGEWMYAKHTEFYDALPHYLLEFDVYDRESATFLDTPCRRELLADGPVAHVPVLATRSFGRLSELTGLVRRSLYKSDGWRETLAALARDAELDAEAVLLRETDNSDLSEGLYVKHEVGGVVAARYKWVRSDFVQSILDSGSHWKNRPILPNGLAD